ncbi:acyl-CoA dehydrogenase C-terminal domain-containing protein, partial [Klebsiella pneumoniae]|nr:acyl-CoA dehydrogenase C-terminal domain-containing protein [Klebsiella pneumoniae]
MWLRMATAAAKLKEDGQGDAAFLDAKLITARYFAERVLPEAGALRRQIEGGAEAIMALPPEMFAAA